MSLRGLLVGAVVLAALSGGVYWSERHPKEETPKGGVAESPKLITLKDEDATQVEIKHAGSEPVVVRKGKSGWQMTAPEAVRTDTDSVSSVVSAVSGLTWDRLVEDKPASLNTFGLSNPSIEVAVTDKGNKRQAIQVGDETPTGGGYFAKLAGDQRVFSINSGTKGNLDKSWKDLRDKRLLTFEEGKVSRIELTAKGPGVEFGRSGQNEWQILKPKPLRADNWQVEELVRKLKEARMDTSVSDEDAKKNTAGFGSGERMGVVTVTDPSGTQTLDVRKKGDDYLVKSSAVDGIWKGNKELAEALNKGVDDFRNKKLFDFGFSDPSKIELRDGAKSYSFVKTGDKWWSSGKQMDPTSVQSLVDKLRELSATKFSDAPLSSPTLEIGVVSLDGKRNEKVLLAKSGTAWYGKRENDPTVYEVESKRAEELQSAAADVKAPPPPPKK